MPGPHPRHRPVRDDVLPQRTHVRDWAPPGWHWEVLPSGAHRLVRNPGPVVDPDLLWWRSRGPHLVQREPAPPEVVRRCVREEGVKYNIDSIKASGEPLTPKNIANKFVRQCGVLVKDQLPISIQEWKDPKTKCPDVTWVDDRAKEKLWESLMEHFTRPDYFTEADVKKGKDAALKKMAIAFNTHKKTVWANYVAAERKTPEFKGTLEKQREHWPAFVKFKESELSKEWSRKTRPMPQKRSSAIGWGQVATRWQCQSGISLSKRCRLHRSLQLH